jgi:hypothetical protein
MDGRMADEEAQVLDALIESFELDADDAAALREYASTPRTLDDVTTGGLSHEERRRLLQQAVVFTYVDGRQSDDEIRIIRDLVRKLEMGEDEAGELIVAAEERAALMIERRRRK